ncbi:MAG: zinc-binding dehydrogenase, partial [Candidatus Omnitrophica bacterium]|nr:zinc-binding dehydrogenase [Candidatus Omnitrophota bacterium]
DPGGYSQFVRVPRINVEHGVYVLPEQVTYDEGTMIEPLACAVRALRLMDIRPGQTVLILGGGISGILNIQVAKLAGARVVVTDINEYRLKKALEFGADDVIDARQAVDVKAERIILCTGAYSAVEQAFRCLDRKGILLLFAIPAKDIAVPIPDFWRNEGRLMSSYGAAPEDLAEALELISERRVDVASTITHRLPMARIQEAFDIVVGAKESLKVVLEP